MGGPKLPQVNTEMKRKVGKEPEGGSKQRKKVTGQRYWFGDSNLSQDP